jgi:hypothetical protein
MKHIKKYTEMSESFWSDTFGNPEVKTAARDALRGKGYSHTAKDERGEAIIFNGQEFYPDQIEYADYNDTGEIPRIEGGKLIITNPAWSM